MFLWPDDNESMRYLNDWDKNIPNLDVVDDYKSEKKEILNWQGDSFPFSFGDVSCSIHELSVAFIFNFLIFSMLLKSFWVL